MSGLETGFILDRQWFRLQGEMERTKRPALLALARVLADTETSYAIIGGVALQTHQAEPRTTLDIDVAVAAYGHIPRGLLQAAGFAPTGRFPHSENWVGPEGTPVQFTDDPALAGAYPACRGDRARNRTPACHQPHRPFAREAPLRLRSGPTPLETLAGPCRCTRTPGVHPDPRTRAYAGGTQRARALAAIDPHASNVTQTDFNKSGSPFFLREKVTMRESNQTLSSFVSIPSIQHRGDPPTRP